MDLVCHDEKVGILLHSGKIDFRSIVPSCLSVSVVSVARSYKSHVSEKEPDRAPGMKALMAGLRGANTS